ncbi:tRNA-(ms[2]io[6]A)-hydroxylase [Paraphotobacterium marinum]|uniref:tRNA-(Ms[2]io[6]A)-hydroxylase n=1 Tax=Paraphotobacterium marinum TaxID=1755811 RepID=A0A220VEF7_9GAMM|nr:tRNA isopentenyl-2-thiomethyl-A-37 hydroxylase MiaE [Paraphotobacterium marinum]ASK78606.1 tRNA-(ms[2]io[6]A)-hydroxylase [Paraphotobacterium marinum]
MNIEDLTKPAIEFLHCETPKEWINEASRKENLSIILLDHLICELKAAQTAMWLIRKYAVDKQSGDHLLSWLKPYEDFVYRNEGSLEKLSKNLKFSKSIISKNGAHFNQDLVNKMVLLINEELHHFYQVLEIMERRNISYRNISAGRYAKGLMSHVRTYEPEALIDKLICGAYIEARSCERFAKLAPHLDDELQKFYFSLLKSEARHFQDYLTLAQNLSKVNIYTRVDYFGKIEASLIQSDDTDFKFHSGKPITKDLMFS